MNSEPEKYFSADNCPVEVGRKFWNNDLRVCQVTRLAAIPARPYADTGETSTWHDTDRGMFDTLTGRMRQYGRLARRFEGLDAEEARAVFASDTYADAVAADEREARQLGITGVPFFVIDEKYGISGAQPTELFQQALA